MNERLMPNIDAMEVDRTSIAKLLSFDSRVSTSSHDNNNFTKFITDACCR
jgi:hypothetical protein